MVGHTIGEGAAFCCPACTRLSSSRRGSAAEVGRLRTLGGIPDRRVAVSAAICVSPCDCDLSLGDRVSGTASRLV